MNLKLYGFLAVMWILILIGSGIVVTILGPLEISGFGDTWIISSIVKGIISIILVMVWIVVMIKIKNWLFKKEIQS